MQINPTNRNAYRLRTKVFLIASALSQYINPAHTGHFNAQYQTYKSPDPNGQQEFRTYSFPWQPLQQYFPNITHPSEANTKSNHTVLRQLWPITCSQYTVWFLEAPYLLDRIYTIRPQNFSLTPYSHPTDEG